MLIDWVRLGWTGNIWLLVRTHGPRAKYLTSLLALPLSQQVHFSVLFIIYYIYFIITSTIWWGTQQSRLQFKCVLTENPPSPGKVGHTTAVYVPYSFWTMVWVLLRPTRTDQWKCCEMRLEAFRPYLRRLESLTICRCQSKGSTFSLVILRPRVLVWLGFEPITSCSADWRSPNSANQAAVKGTRKWTNFPYKSSCIILLQN